MDIPLIFTIIFVLTTTILFFISYHKYKYRTDNPHHPICLKKPIKGLTNEAMCKNMYVNKLDKTIYIIIPILMGICAASIFCLIYILI